MSVIENDYIAGLSVKDGTSHLEVALEEHRYDKVAPSELTLIPALEEDGIVQTTIEDSKHEFVVGFGRNPYGRFSLSASFDPITGR